jgi:all-trans-8'-apo-beta-carotenal 15,15'-oxygenase
MISQRGAPSAVQDAPGVIARSSANEALMRGRILRAMVRSHETVSGEVDTELPIVEGKLPGELRGVFYRVVPGRMERGGVRYQHPFDGDGMILRFAIEDGRVHYRNRYVRTKEFVEEDQAGRILYRSLGTDRPGGSTANAFRMRFKNPANVALVHHAGMLLALWDAGLPHRIDPTTLETVGLWDFDGALRSNRLGAKLRGGEIPFGAHPCLDRRTGHLENFGILQGRPPTMKLFSVNTSGRLTEMGEHSLQEHGIIHDFRLTPHYRVFFDSSLRHDLLPMLLGLKCPLDAVSYDDTRPIRALLSLRDGGAPILINGSTSGFLYHFSNAFEDDEGRVVADVFLMQGYPNLVDFRNLWTKDLTTFVKPRLTRFIIDPVRRTMTETELTTYHGDFSAIHPARAGLRHRFVWHVASPTTQVVPYHGGLLKLDLEDPSRNVFRDFGADLPSEPSLVPRDHENETDEGFLVLTLYVAAEHRSDLLVLDARDLHTICRARLPHHVPRGFHGTWLDASH